MDDELRAAAAATLAELRERALTDGPNHAVETFESFHENLDLNCDALLRRIEDRRTVSNPAYHRSFALAAKLVLLAGRDGDALDRFMGTARPRRDDASERLAACENLLRGLGDDHEWILVNTEAGPSVRGSWEGPQDTGLADINLVETAVTIHLGGEDELELEIETHPGARSPSP